MATNENEQGSTMYGKAMALACAAGMTVAGAADAATFDFSFRAQVVQFGNATDVYLGSGKLFADDAGDGTFAVTGATGISTIEGFPEFSRDIDGGEGTLAMGDGGVITALDLFLFGGAFYGFTPNGDGTYAVMLGEVGAPAGTLTITAATAGVPEPATWALMMLGFGVAGAAMRRRHVPTGSAAIA